MDIKQLTKEQIEMLRERLPDEAVSQHPTKTYLSSIKAIYVIERLNKVFGIGKWTYKVKIIDNKTDMIVVKVGLTVSEYGIYFESFGGNDNGGENSKNFDLGDAYKGATTDAITKIASYLEIGMDVFKGLHKGKSSNTYQKPQETQTNVPQTNISKFTSQLDRESLAPKCPKCQSYQIISKKTGNYYCYDCWSKSKGIPAKTQTEQIAQDQELTIEELNNILI